MRWAIAVLATIAAVAIAVPFGRNGAWPWALTAVGLALFWIAAPTHSYNWTATLALVGFTLLAAAMVLRFSTVSWALPGLLAATAAWDLCQLQQRLLLSDDVRDRAVYLRTHFLQLAAVLIGGWVLGLLAMRTTIPLSFVGSLGLLLLLVLSLAMVVKAARGSENAAD